MDVHFSTSLSLHSEIIPFFLKKETTFLFPSLYFHYANHKKGFDMFRLLVGGVTLAALGYALKEYCEEEGCPWDEYEDEIEKKDDKDSDMEENISKEFRKKKKSFLKESIEVYSQYIEKYNIEDSITCNPKIKKQLLTKEALEYTQIIEETLEILSHNLKINILNIESLNNLEEIKDKINSQMEAICKLSHLKLYKNDKLNKEEILQTLVDTMRFALHKDNIYVDLSSTFTLGGKEYE